MSEQKPSSDALEALYGLLAEDLAKRLKDGTATAADRAVALNLLRQTGVVGLVKPGSPERTVAEALAEDDTPFDADEEFERQRRLFSGAGRS